MTGQAYDEHSRSRVRTLQIVVAAMALGALVFLLAGFFLPHEESAPFPKLILTYVSLAYGLIAVLGYVAVPGVLTAPGRKRIARSAHHHSGDESPPETLSASDARRLLALFAEVLIIRCAMVEGGALLAGLAYLIERQGFAFLVAAWMILLLVVQIPTATRVQRWVEEQLPLLEKLRPAAV